MVICRKLVQKRAFWRRNRGPRKGFESQRVKNSPPNGSTRLTKLLPRHGVNWRFMGTTGSILNTEPLLINLAPLKKSTSQQQNSTPGNLEMLLKPIEEKID